MTNKIIYAILASLIFLNSSSQEIKYDKNYSIACHNCFEKSYASNITEVFPYTTNIELDIWDSRIGIGGYKSMTQDWYVKHTFLESGNKNCCGGSFKDCLIRIKNWCDKNPNHNAITIFLDKKENWSEPNETRKPEDLDNLIQSIFPEEKIYNPKKFLCEKENLKEAALANTWPVLDTLKGKIIFVLTDGTEITNRSPLNEYLKLQKNNAICFVAPEVKNEDEIQVPIGFSQENIPNIVFYNLQYPNRHLAVKINSVNCLSRVYDSPLSPETRERYNELINGKVNFIAMFDYKLQK